MSLPEDLLQYDLPVNQLFIASQLRLEEEREQKEGESLQQLIRSQAATKDSLRTAEFLEKLPNELILQVLAHVPLEDLVRFSRTNRRLRHTSFDGSLWKRFDFSRRSRVLALDEDSKRSFLGAFFFSALPVAGPNITHIYLNGFSSGDIDDSAILLLSRHCHGLKHFNFSGLESITEASIEAITKYCHKLETLYLSNLKAVTDRSLALIGLHLPHLTFLDLSAFTLSSKITDVGLLPVLRKCVNLQTLILVGCHLLSDESLVEMSLHNPELKNLDCQGCFQLTDMGIIKVLTNCRSLESLDISYCWRCTDLPFRTTFPENLRTLSCQFCYQLGDQTVVQVSNYPRLTFANFSYCCNLSLISRDVLDAHGIVGVFDGCKSITGSEIDLN